MAIVNFRHFPHLNCMYNPAGNSYQIHCNKWRLDADNKGKNHFSIYNMYYYQDIQRFCPDKSQTMLLRRLKAISPCESNLKKDIFHVSFFNMKINTLYQLYSRPFVILTCISCVNQAFMDGLRFLNFWVIERSGYCYILNQTTKSTTRLTYILRIDEWSI